MLKQKEKSINFGIALIEVLITYVVFFIANCLRNDDCALNQEYTLLLIFIGPIWFTLLRFHNIARIYRVNPYSYIVFSYGIIISVGILLLSLLILATHSTQISRLFLLYFAVLNFITLTSFKVVLYFIFKLIRAKGKNTINAIIIGDEEIEPIIEKLERNDFWGYKIIAIFSNNNTVLEKYEHKYQTYSLEASINEFIETNPIDEVIYTSEDLNREKIVRLIYSCLEVGVTFRLSSQLLNMAKARSTLQYLEETPFFTFQNTPDNYFNLQVKTMLDYIFALCVIIIGSPLFIILGVLVKFTSKGPIIFKQTRVGKNGREFQLLKFRTMVTNAEDLLQTIAKDNEQEGPVFKIKNDPRVTKIGKFLRKTSLDELPQFFNILKGDMALVGPRPPIPSEVEQYERWQLRRLSMKPGITCIWQVSGRNNIPFEKWMKLDLQYIDSWSLKLDFIIIFKTIKTILARNGQ